MRPNPQEFPERIRTLRAAVEAADMVRNGLPPDLLASLEELAQQAAEHSESMEMLLELTARGLLEISARSVSTRKTLAESIIYGLTVAERFFSLPDNPIRDSLLEDTILELSLILDGEEEAMPSAPPVEVDRWEEMNEICALLFQADPSETEDLAALLSRMEHLLLAFRWEPDLEARLKLAVGKLFSIVHEETSDPNQDLEDILRILDETRLGEAPKSTSEPSEGLATSALLPEDADLELLRDFLAESRDFLEAAEGALLTLEEDPKDEEAINTVFRAFHTLKGTSGFLGLQHVTELAHHAEWLLSRIRDGEIQCVGVYAELSLRSVDVLKDLLTAIQSIADGVPSPLPGGYSPLLKALKSPDDPAVSQALLKEIAIAQVTDSLQEKTQESSAKPSASSDATVRVRTDRLDSLVDLVGELVIAQTMIAQDPNVVAAKQTELAQKITHASKIVRDLQDLSMSMRMFPLKTTFQKMARLVRDTAYKSGKQVEFHSDGEETEIDRNIVDIIGDPLVHMVRNAVDHGIEHPEERIALGKPKRGQIWLSAYNAGGNVVVELRDDGRGLNREKILKKALEKGLIATDKGLSDSEVFGLIFLPGFSTADQVTDLSGRGVGMDVVRKNIESLRGRIEISSTPGQGTTFYIFLPLTLAITDGMLVRVGHERYILPIINIAISFRPDRKSLSTVTGTGEMVMLRDDLLPLVRLHRIFGIGAAQEDPTEGLLVVVSDGDRRCALLVDELLGQHQVVAKSLGTGLGKVPGVSGGAILGDGRVGLILDPPQLISLSRQN